jgi:hypothetical protein
MTDIPPGTMVSFIDPVSEKPVKGIVKMEGRKFLGVQYVGKCLPAAPGKQPRTLCKEGEDIFAWINISKEKVFVIR